MTLVGRGLRAAASLLLAVLMIAVVLPRVTGTGWPAVIAVAERLSAADVALLLAVWLGSLLAYTWVLTASLPGLTHGQALTMNVSGSAVSNLVPFGGALGVAVGYAMTRSWGFSAPAFALSAVVAGLWNVLAKLALPAVALLALLLTGSLPGRRLAIAAGLAGLVLVLMVALLAGLLSSERVARRTAVVVGAFRPDWHDHVLGLRLRVRGLLRRRWAVLSAAMLGFLAGQALLQWLVLYLLGTTLSPAQVFAGFAFGRLLSTIVITPGGVGLSETGAAALLVALGGDPAVTTSGVLLFSAFTFALEIPAGAVGYLVWLTRRSWRAS